MWRVITNNTWPEIHYNKYFTLQIAPKHNIKLWYFALSCKRSAVLLHMRFWYSSTVVISIIYHVKKRQISKKHCKIMFVFVQNMMLRCVVQPTCISCHTKGLYFPTRNCPKWKMYFNRMHQHRDRSQMTSAKRGEGGG